MNFLNLNMRKIVLLFFACLLPLISINVQQKPLESNWVSRPFFLLSQSIQNVFYMFSADVRNTTGLYINLVNIKKDSGELRVQNEKLQAELQVLRERETEIDRLRQLLEFKASTPMKLIAAEVIGKDLITDHNTMTINKGSEDGIRNGMGVVTLDGVVGYIFRPEAHQSSVMLVTDRYSVVDGVVQRSRARGIVEGKGTQEGSLKYVERTEDVKIGDIIVTGGLDNLFPKGFPIAVVESVERKTHSVSLKVELKPLVDPAKVEEVFIIAEAKEQDLSERFIPPSASGDESQATGAIPTAASGTSDSAKPVTKSTETKIIPKSAEKPALKPAIPAGASPTTTTTQPPKPTALKPVTPKSTTTTTSATTTTTVPPTTGDE